MRYGLALALVTTLLSAGYANAAETAGTIAVTAAVNANCTVGSLRPLDFGSQDASQERVIDAQAQALTIACTRGATSVAIGLTEGANSQSGSRNLGSGQGHVRYEVYTAADHSVVWNLANTVEYVPASAQPVNLSLYGRAIAPKGTPAGSYSDVLLALVNF